jgi:hypothetical protein
MRYKRSWGQVAVAGLRHVDCIHLRPECIDSDKILPTLKNVDKLNFENVKNVADCLFTCIVSSVKVVLSVDSGLPQCNINNMLVFYPEGHRICAHTNVCVHTVIVRDKRIRA